MRRGNRRLSPWRVFLALAIIAGVTVAGNIGSKHIESERSAAARAPWFAPYVDVTSTPRFAFEQLDPTPNRDVVLSFIVSSPKDGCIPTWGGAYTMDQASGALDLDRRIARLRQQNGKIAVSFGGLINNELAVGCSDPTKLKEAYSSVIERYKIDTIDLDLEKIGLTDVVAGERRATAIAELQKERRAAGKNLAVWVTLPVAPQGLTEDGTNAVSLLLSKKVDLAGVNVMTMDYGSSRVEGQSMLAASEAALNETKRQLQILYKRANIQLNDATVWSKIGATPMIGQNDVPKEIFTLDDAKAFNKFALARGVGRMSMWSANRDVACGSNYIDTKVVSDSCSGVAQGKRGFANLLGEGFKGNLSHSASIITSPDASTTVQAKDDPSNSPYQIWQESGAYLQGTKVVWHRNVYMAKWWTQGDLPDDPVLQSWQTPWELVGPVLPNEKPIPQPTLAPGTYPEWSGTKAYETGDRVLFGGIPYQSKWWNTGSSPAAASSNPNGSPWAPLTQAQINEIQK